MEAFYKIHRQLLEHRPKHVRRTLMDELDPTHRFICVRGTRGIGKTSFLLDYVAEHYSPASEECLYANLNHFYFSEHTLYDFVKAFVATGGELLLLDQIFKYPNWSAELRRCHEEFSALRIIFAASSVMCMAEEADFIKVYDLRGFSFREYYGFVNNVEHPAYSLEDILCHHEDIAASIANECHPSVAFNDYLKQGFYPFFQENVASFGEMLVKTMNMILEVDVVYIHQIEPAYLYKLRKLLYLVASNTSNTTNVSMMSKEIGTSRATVMNYLKYLADAGMITMLYKSGEEYPKKPHRLYLNNTNIAHTLSLQEPQMDELRKIFLLSHLTPHYSVSAGETGGVDFVVDGQYALRATDMMRRRGDTSTYFVVDNLTVGHGRQIPLWLFGFLY
ncbi:AAA family ATPase [Porphyromonas sp.]|uniref:AAA family ATPase n=1 Tax=Porphyromonas sp. TaxID=1924944 RepID=UPI0026DBD98C|nr:AAA family ATPase [Porphyromonas sp.]MDO4770954.1 AAA family ATPase [Porphyromonas sp.]